MAFPSPSTGYNRSLLHNATDVADVVDVSLYISLALFWLNITIDVLGIAGNVLTIIVLAHRRIRCSTSTLLITMGLYDSSFLLTELGYSLHEVISDEIETTPSAHSTILYIAATGSIYTAVAVTMERYMAVKHPIRARSHCHTSVMWKPIVGIFAMSLAMNLPRLAALHEASSQPNYTDMGLFSFRVNETNTDLQETLVTKTHLDSRAFRVTETGTHSNNTHRGVFGFEVNETNMDLQAIRVNNTNLDSQVFLVTETNLGLPVFGNNESAHQSSFEDIETTVIFVDCYVKPVKNTQRFLYCTLFPACVILVFPFAIILVLNVLILTTLSQRRRSLTTIMTPVADKGRTLTRTALGITSCFFVFCVFPGVYYIIRYVFKVSFGEVNRVMENAIYTLLLVNFSTNFVLYCFLGKTFRNIFLDLIRFNRTSGSRCSSKAIFIRGQSLGQSSMDSGF